jgi:hypothetical protein
MQSNQEQDFGSLLNNFSGSEPQGQTTDSQDFGSLLNAQSTPQQPKARPTGKPSIDDAISQEGADHLKPVIAALYGQESGSGATQRTSTDGARGGMQIMPDTFRRYARPGERIDDPTDNMRVGVRIVKTLGDKFNNDPAKIATAYFSGDGNVNTGSGNAWKRDHADGNGKRVSSYVNDVVNRMGGSQLQLGSSKPTEKDPIDSIPDWKDVEQKPEYQAFTPTEKQQAKEAYFDRFVAPVAGNQAGKLREQFLANKPTSEATLGNFLADTWEATKGLPGAGAAAAGAMAQGGDPAEINTGSLTDQMIKSARARAEENAKVKGANDPYVDYMGFKINRQDVRNFPQNAAFSVASMGASLLGGLTAGTGVGLATGGVGAVPAAVAGGAAAGGAAAYRMDTNSFMRDLRDSMDKASVEQRGTPLTNDEFVSIAQAPEMQQAAKQYGLQVRGSGNIGDMAREHGVHEAGWEALGNTITMGAGKFIIKEAMKGGLIKPALGAAGVLAGEVATETPTQMGQHNVEVQAGLSNEPKRDWTSGADWQQSFEEVAGPTALTSLVMGGGAAAYGAAKKALSQTPQNVTPDGRLEQSATGQTATPAEPAPIDVHPTTAAADAVVNDAINQFGVPDHVVASDLTPSGPPATSDDDVMNFAESRLNELLTKQDGTIETVMGETGPTDQEVPGVGLSNAEQAELDALLAAQGDAKALRTLYGFDRVNVPSDQSQLATQGNAPAPQQGATSQPEAGQVVPTATEPALEAAQNEEDQRQTEELGLAPSTGTSEPIGGSIGTTDQSQPAINPAIAQDNTVNTIGNTGQQNNAVQTDDAVDKYADIPDIGSPSNVSEAEGMRLLGFSEQEIEEATAKPSKIGPSGTVKEPIENILAQVKAYANGSRGPVFVDSNKGLNESVLRDNGMRVMQSKFGGFYVVKKSDAQSIADIEKNNDKETARAQILGYVQSKNELNTATPVTVVQATDANGAVVHEQAVNQERQAEAEANAAPIAQANGGVVNVTTPEQAIKGRNANGQAQENQAAQAEQTQAQEQKAPVAGGGVEQVASYGQRNTDRIARANKATSQNELSAIESEENADKERHFDGTQKLASAVRDRKNQLDSYERDKAEIAKYNAGEWVVVSSSGSKSSSEQAAISLSTNNPTEEFEVIPWQNDGWAVRKRKKPAAPKTEKQARAQKDYSEKWFGSQDKAQAFINKQGIGESHEVAQDGKRFVIKARGGEVRQGVVGDMLKSGEVVMTNTGRKTTPFPQVKTENNRQSANTLKAVDSWLIANALAEAEARGDEFNARQFRNVNPKNVTQSDKDAAETYLFDDFIPTVPPSIFKNPEKATTEKAAKAQRDDSDLPQGWAAAGKGIATNNDPQTGGIVDKAIASGKWFAIPNKEGLPQLEGFDTRKQAIDALQKAVAADSDKAKPTANTVFTEDAAEKARAILKSKLGQLNSGIDPEIMQAGITLAGYHIEKGARTFAAYSKAMIDDMGDVVKPYLKSWYLGVKFDPRAAGFDGMDDASVVEKADVEAVATTKATSKQFDLHTPEGKFEVAKQVSDHFLGGGKFDTIVQARKFISDITGVEIKPATELAKQADETIETAVVLASREIVEAGRKQGRSSAIIYDRLLDLFNRQPNLSVRTSTSVRDQAYSTPAPLAYVASELAGVTGNTKMIESTAGNGMLAIGASTKNAVINELNPKRAAMLKAIGFDATIQNAATQTLAPAKSIQSVVINPPFGATKDDNGETIVYEIKPNYGTREVDHAIVFKTLDTMKDDGKAVLIVGGVNETDEERRREDYRGKSKRTFYYNLYNDYNVTDHFTVDGKLYTKQGASYPVDVIVIDGRGKSARDLPAAQLPEIISSYEELKGKLNGKQGSVGAGVVSTNGVDSGAGQSGGSNGTGVGGSTDGQSNGNGTSVGQSSTSNNASVPVSGDAANGRTATSGGVSVQGKSESTGVSERSDGQSVSNASKGKRSSTPIDRGNGVGELGGTSVVAGERVGNGLSDRRGEEQETETQVAYTPHSGAASVGTLVPKAMRDAIDASLSKIEDQVGSIDQYVADNLGLDTQEVSKYFSAEQVDALALAIRNAEAGRGFIIGDQTGIGKGRVVAAMIKYALVNGKTPIFVTEKPNLYADMIRDLDDIGMTKELALDTAKPKILITNGGESIPYTLLRTENGEVTETNLTLRAPKSGAALDKIMVGMRGDDSLGDYKVIFTTYSQLQTVKGKETERQKFVKHFGNSNYMIFDESHNAGGGGETQVRTKDQRNARADFLRKEGRSLVLGRAAFVRELVDIAFGTFFSSATYAKRPDVMDLYSSTNMKLAVNKISDLGDAIKHGGVPMQQAVANMLTTDGQYIRRERTFAGVSYDTVETKVDRETAENMASAMRSILAFSRAKEAIVKQMQKELDKAGGVVKGMGEKTTVQSATFGSIMHNLIDQMLLSLKAQDSVKHAVERLKSGEKVVMTVSNTMGSFLKDYADEMGLKTGDPVGLSFKDLYMRYLDRQRVVKIKLPNGETKEHRLTDNELGQRLSEMFAKVRDQIENAGFGSAPISPIDYLHSELQKAGFKTDEITGRNMTLDYSSGTPILSTRNSTIRQRVGAVRGFNNGDTDVIILNQAGSTGLSLHASSKVKDQRKRHMIIVQAEKNIDTHMQMLGRVHRTGQVIAPAYSQMMADIPAEMRPASVLMKKMASLSANTTASRKSSVTAEGVVDFMNDYGGQVVHEYLRDNQEVLEALGGSKVVDVSDNSEDGTEEDIRKFTGYIPILPIKQQEEIYADLIDRYNELIERENALGTNKLEAKAIDLDAKTLSSTQITENKGVQSVFAEPASMEQVDVKRSVRPLSSAEVQKLVDERLDGKQPDAIADDMKTGLKERASKFAQARIKQFAEAGMDEITLGRHRDSLTANYNNTLNILNNYSIGDKIVVSDKEGYRMYGVITDIVNRASTANPAAGSSWKMHIAVANGESKTITLSFSQIGSRYTLGKESTVNWYNPESKTFENMPLLNVFDLGATTRREKRWIVTGNILAGFARHPGQIITYTKDDGTTTQGVLMNRQFDFAAVQKNAPVTMRSADDAMRFLNEVSNAMVGKDDEQSGIEIIKRYGNYQFSAPAAKSKGGAIYLDKRLTDALGTDFYKRGKFMIASVNDEYEARAALEYLIKDRGEPIIALTQTEKAKEMFRPAQPKPSRNTASTANPHDVASLTDRLRTVADKENGDGFFDALVGTGKFKVVTSSEIAHLSNDARDQAFYNPADDTSYFVSDRISKNVSNDYLHGLLLHEVSVHAMKLGQDDAAFAKIKDQFSKMRRVSPAVATAYEKAEKSGTPSDEEALGYFVEANPKSSITQRLIAWIKSALRRMGLSTKWTNSLSEADVIAMASSALRRAPSDLVFDGNERGEVRASKTERLAPNGKPSNLNAMQYAQVRTPEFKAWFGDWENDPANASKVVDENGEPLVVYHGTANDITEFNLESDPLHRENDKGKVFLTANKKWASAYIEQYWKGRNNLIAFFKTEHRPPAVMALFVNLKTPSIQDRTKSSRGVPEWYDSQPVSFFEDKVTSQGKDGMIILSGIDTMVIATKSNQIKSATGNTGAFSSDNNDIRFSKISTNVKNNLVQFFGNQHGKSLKTWNTWDKTLATQYHKALKDKHFGKVFNLINAMQNEVSLTSIRPSELAPGILPRVDDIKTAARVLIKGKKADSNMDKAANALFAGTLAGENVMAGKVWSDDELRNNFGLDDTGIALYNQARAAIDASLDEVAAAEGYAMAQGFIAKSLRAQVINNPQIAESLILEALERQVKTLDLAIDAAKLAGNEAQAASLGESRKAFNETITNVERIFTTARNLKMAGYAPLMRFGKFSVLAQAVDPVTGNVEKDVNGESITLFYGQYETEGEAKSVRNQLESKYADRDDVRVTSGVKSQSAHELYAGISPETLALFADAVGQGATMKKYYQLALTERSALKRRLERKGTAGFSSDMPRVLSNFITSNGRFAAQRYYLRDLNSAIKYIPKEKGDVLDEAIELKKFIVNPNDPAAPVSSVLFAWFLGGSVASAAINLTQPVMMTGPYLSQFGVKEATAALTHALPYALGKKQITDSALKEGLKRASQEGIVDAQEIFHLYSVGAQSVASGLVNSLSRLPGVGKKIKAGSESARARTNAFLTLWGSMFSTAESFNRKLTFIAAWKVAEATKKKKPYDFAVRAVNETQGIYNKVNRPNLARGPVGRVVMTFKQYSIMYAELLSRMYKHGGPEGKRAALIMLGVLMLAAGEEGLPFAQDLDDLIDTLGQAFGLDTNMRRNKRRVAHELIGEKMGDLFLYGISSQLPIDFAGRMGMGNLIPGTSILKPSDEQGRNRQVEEVFGAGAGMIGQIADAYDAATEGNWGKAGQNMMPTAIKNLAASVQMASKGYATDARGRKVVETNGLDALGKAIGFNPTKVAEETRRTAPVQQDIALQKKTEASIVDQWAQGAADNDQALMDKAAKRLNDWNESNPKTRISINAEQIRAKSRQLLTDKNNRLLKTTPREMRGTVGLDLIK